MITCLYVGLFVHSAVCFMFLPFYVLCTDCAVVFYEQHCTLVIH